MTPTEPAETSTADAQSGLARRLGPIDATTIVIGSMIGSGIFITSADSARLVGSPGWLLVAWALAGLLTICGAVSVAEVAAMIPRAGGQYVFLRRAYGPAVGFLFGWATFLVVGTGTIAAVAVAFAKFLGVFFAGVSAESYLIRPIHLGGSGYALSLSTQQLVAVGLIVVLTLTNTRGLDIGKWIQNVFTFTKTAALIGLIVVGLTFGVNRNSAAWTASWWDSAANGWSLATAAPGLGVSIGWLGFALLLGKAMIGPLFSQTAWNSVTFTGGEVRQPGRTLPIALVIGCGSVVLLYMLANVAYLTSLPFDGIRNAPEDRVGTALMRSALGETGVLLMAGAILVSTFGCVNGLVLSGARVFYAMAEDGLFFRQAKRLNAFQVPSFALVAQGIWAAVLTLPRTVNVGANDAVSYGNLYGQLLDFLTPVDLTLYMLMVGTLLVFRATRPDAERPYRTFLYPLPPLIYLGLAILLVLTFLYVEPRTCGIGFGIALSGLPVYWLWSRTAGAKDALAASHARHQD